MRYYETFKQNWKNMGIPVVTTGKQLHKKESRNRNKYRTTQKVFRIRSECGSGSRVLMTKNWKYYSWKILTYFWKKKLCPKASIKDVQATWDAFGTQKRTSSTSKFEISSLFSIFEDPADQIHADLDQKRLTQRNNSKQLQLQRRNYFRWNWISET